jgi:hypothetical protein
MNDKKVLEALRLCEQALDFGDGVPVLHQIRQLLHDAVTDTPDDDEMMELTADGAPPRLGVLGWDEDDPDVNPDLNSPAG